MNYLQNTKNLHFFVTFFKKCKLLTNKSKTRNEDRKYYFTEKVTSTYCEQIPLNSFYDDSIFNTHIHQGK